ncbi:MAG: translocation/assembly module TamB domain-containing protein [Chitinophagaceae bacterium]|nr:translocation/assembly module TamB domain-containing protein [Chitinophagaceae bacterium]
MSLKRFKKISLWVLGILLFLLTACYLMIQSEWGQNYITRQVTTRLSKKLNAQVRIGHVSLSLFNKINIDDVLIEDQHRDTLMTAGRIRVRITDWFFVKDEVELKYIGLEDAHVQLKRTDSVWNYQFLIDYFSGGGGSGKGGVELDLKKIELTNVHFDQIDQWRGEDMKFYVGKLDLDAEAINFGQKQATINSLVLSQPELLIRQYTGNRPQKTTVKSPEVLKGEKVIDSLLKWNKAGWVLQADLIEIKNGSFRTERAGKEPLPYFDGQHIAFTSIKAEFRQLHWEKDTIQTQLSLSSKERSGFEVKSMVADAKVTPESMAFTKMEIRTNKSIIRQAYTMRYEDFNNDMGDYINKVSMEADFADAEIDSDDIAFFSPNLSEWKKKIRVNGRARGTVSDLFADNLEISAGENTYLNGDISLVGLPDIDQTFIDFKANRFRTNYADAAGLFPQLRKVKNPKLSSINYLDFTGSFTGFIRDFVTYGNIQTNLGRITTDLNMKLPAGRAPIYSGSISANNFQLDKFLDNSNLGSITFDGKVLGRGLEWESLIAGIDGRIKSVIVKNYEYKNITLNGQMDKRRFTGLATADDENLDMKMNGVIDLNGETPSFDLVAEINRASLKALNLSNENLGVTGKFNLNFTGDNIDNFLGTITGSNIEFVRDTISLYLKGLSVISDIEDGKKLLSLESDEFSGEVEGDFSLRELPAAFTLFLNKYYPSYVAPPRQDPGKEVFTFSIRTRYIDDLTKIIDPRISGLSNSTIKGRINLPKNELELDADIPYFAYNNIQFNNTQVQARGDLEKLSFTGAVDQVNFSDSTYLPNTKLSFVSQNDISDVRIITDRNSGTLGSTEIGARVQTFDDGVSIQFDSSSFVLNGKKWSIDENGELSLRKNTVSYGQLILRESNQEIKLSTIPSDVGDWNDVRIDLKDINLGDISPYVMKNGRVEGAASGTVMIEDPQNKLNILSDIRTNELRWDDDSIGQVNANITFISKTGELTGKAVNTNPDEKVALDLKFNLKDSTGTIDDVLEVNAENYPINIVERFTGALFSDLEGYATGKVKLINPGGKIKVIGKPRLRNAAVTVDFTKCRYELQDTEIEFTEDEINLGTLTLRDRFQRQATVQGWIRHKSFGDMSYNITARTGVLPLELLNTTEKDNQTFFGRARGTGSLVLTGPQSDMQLKINATASNNDSSYITILSSDSRESGISDFMVERQYGQEMIAGRTQGGETNITYDVDLRANTLVTINVILDPLTGDQIQGRGTGDLKIRSGTSEDLSIRGRYDITEGSYMFTFQSFIRKPFELLKNAGNYIEWTGDPYNANIRIDAMYKNDKKVSFAPIVNSGVNLNSNNANIRDYVYVIAKLRGDLFRPDISFALDFPEGSPAKTDPELSFTFKQLQNNEDELNKQVAYLILSDNFAPLGNSAADITSFGDAVVNTITGKIANEVNKLLNNFLTKIDPNLRINFSSSFQRDFFNQSTSTIGFDRASSNLTIGRSFLDNRIILTVEGAFDVPIRADANYSTQLLPNITTEILINKSGSLRATFFYKENIDFLTGASFTSNSKARKYGTSLAFRKEFDYILPRKKKKKSP